MYRTVIIIGIVSTVLFVQTLLQPLSATGMSFTEEFTDTNLQDPTLTTAHWDTDEEALVLAKWKRRFGVLQGLAHGSAVDIGEIVNDTRAIAVGDVDGDGDLDMVTGNNSGQPNKLYLNDGSIPFSEMMDGSVIGSGDRELTFAIALGDVDGDGDLDVVVGNSGTNKLYLNDGSANPFSEIVNGSAIGSGDMDATLAIALEDVNGDGDLDVVAGNRGGNKLYLNDGSGSPFSGIVNGNAIGSGDDDDTRCIALGDVNGDGDLDVVAGNSGQPNKLYLNDGSSLFHEVVGNAIGSGDSDFTYALALGDVDRDGDLDVVAGNSGQPNKLYSNDGSATPFSEIVVGGAIGIGDTDETYAVALGDMDGDGDLEVIAGNWGTTKLYLNDGSTSPFSGIVHGHAIGNRDGDLTFALALEDVDGDGDLDVFAGNGGMSKLYLNDGSASPFSRIVNGTAIGRDDIQLTFAMALGDVDSDGDLDVVAGNRGQPNKLYLNDGSANPFSGIAKGSAIGSGDTDQTLAIALGDVDGDGDLDVVVGNEFGTNKLYLNDGSASPFGGIVNGSVIGSGDRDGTLAIALGDVDGDGDLDVFAGNEFETTKLYLNDGSTIPFSGIVNGSVIGSGDFDFTQALALGDVDGDGDLDVVVGNSGTSKLYLNDGSVNPFNGIVNGSAIDSGDEVDTFAIALGDMDGDGDLDVVAGNNGTNKLYLNDGSHSPFSGIVNGSAIGSSDQDRTRALALGDVDGDGDLDVVAGNDGQMNRLYLNDGSGNPFSGIVGGSAIGSSDIDFTEALALGDVDGDGDLDVVAGTRNRTNKLYLNDGSVSPFSGLVTGSVIGNGDIDLTMSLALGDVNGDGDLDVVAGNQIGANKLYLNDGSANPFSEIVNGSTIGSGDTDATLAIALEDVDGDGDLDVAVGNSGTNKLYLNDGSASPFGGIVTGSAIGSGDVDSTKAITLGDLDGDGDLDVVAGNGGTNKLYLNDGSASPFGAIVTGNAIGSGDDELTEAIALGDVDRDGDLDVVAGNSGTNKLYLNDGSANPLSGIVNGSAIGSGDTDDTKALALEDVDKDGDLDVVAGNSGTNKLYLNDGSASPFSGIVHGGAIGSGDTDSTFAIALGDVDRDGDLDVVEGNRGQTNKLNPHTGFDTARNQAGSLEVDTDLGPLGQVLLSTIQSTPPNTELRYYLSNNGGTKWSQVKPDRLFTFPTAGADLRWRAELHSLSPVRTPVLDSLTLALILSQTYDDYISSQNLTGTNANFADDADGDGSANGYEWATGTAATNPTSFTPLSFSGTGQNTRIAFTRNIDATDMVMILEHNPDLSNTNSWTGISTNILGRWSTASPVTETGMTNPVQVAIPAIFTNTVQGSFRLRIDL